jgi:hypothetical protein
MNARNQLPPPAYDLSRQMATRSHGQHRRHLRRRSVVQQSMKDHFMTGEQTNDGVVIDDSFL